MDKGILEENDLEIPTGTSWKNLLNTYSKQYYKTGIKRFLKDLS